MDCPKCQGKLKTVQTIQYDGSVTLRRKKCIECFALYHTREVIEEEGVKDEADR